MLGGGLLWWVGGWLGMGWSCLGAEGHQKTFFSCLVFVTAEEEGAFLPSLARSLSLFLLVCHLSCRSPAHSLTLFTSDSCSFLFTAVYLLCSEMEDGALAGAPSSRGGENEQRSQRWMTE